MDETLSAGTLLMLFIGAILAMAVGMGVRIVPQGSNYVVQRLGKYLKTLPPGLNFIIPFVDDVAARVTTKEIVLDIPGQEVITRDNAVIIANAVAFIQVTKPDQAIYGVENYEQAIVNIIQTTLRSIIGGTALDDALSSREEIRVKLKDGIADNITDWGITLKNVEIQDIKPSVTMQQAMEAQAAAERLRRATVTKAEGEKAAAILEAQGRMEASKLDAEAQVILSNASKVAIENVSGAIQGQELPAMYLLGQKYIEAIGDVAASDNAKTMIIPADLPAAIRGMLGK
ncbi:SPFH/Band 7/PHB domain protein [Mariprofundus erugo]|uniref:SPFH/Band 7/PHB domain protein n=1 Tax=Mariprofundus erugo TaxID=2528639 RepID=A0A5R9GWC9_9PROT|nr:SPFH domain-containing protein [Mariprofundus erugo]TLS68242.1 SPFH/Band 7/PHB domain protein [Mariprofundus erugo]TLS77098.1 SPFH/Band 7/PHB domain protein [Mariprofundus erugo]